MTHRFKGILIDFYGTICGGDRQAVELTCERVVRECRLSLSPQLFAVRWGERFFKTIERSNFEAFRTLHECEVTSLVETLGDLGVTTDAEPLVAELDEYWRNPPVYDDAAAFLCDLRMPVCCVSNADTQPLMTAIQRVGLKFDDIVSSEQVRCYKPHPSIFLSALDRLGLTPEEVVHIGDSLHSDVAGAAAAGLKSVWVCREQRIHDIGVDITPTWKCRTLNAISCDGLT